MALIGLATSVFLVVLVGAIGAAAVGELWGEGWARLYIIAHVAAMSVSGWIGVWVAARLPKENRDG